MNCPCGTGASYEACCGALHAGARQAETAEQLMRSRYVAFTRGDSRYLSHSASDDDADWDATAAWAKSVQWLGLTIVAAGADTVEFVARYLEDGQLVSLHEKSRFSKTPEGRWRYDDGESDLKTTRVERNDPCPCGSGKKFKQCHQ